MSSLPDISPGVKSPGLLTHALRVLGFIVRQLRRPADFLDGPVSVAILRYVVRRERRRRGIEVPR